MRIERNIALGSALLPVWFIAVYAAVSSQRPNFRHFNQAVSELGSWDVPNLWLWNVLGYMIPGLVIFLLGIVVQRKFQPQGFTKIPFWCLSLSGLFMLIAGIFPGDFENRRSLTMLLHMLGSFGSGLFFMIAAFWLPGHFRARSTWRWLYVPLIGIAVAMIVNAIFITNSRVPGLGQRIGFACYFVWTALIGYALYRDLGQQQITSSV